MSSQQAWVSVTEAISLTGKTEITIRRWLKLNKNDASKTIKKGNKAYINPDAISQDYPFIKDYQKTEERHTRHKKEAMQIVQNTETIKELSEHLKSKDEHIQLLVVKKNRSLIYLAATFVCIWVLVLAISFFCFKFYRSELISNQEEKVRLINEKHALEISQNKLRHNEALVFQEKQRQNLQELYNAEENAREITELRTKIAQKDARIEKLTDDLQELLKASLAKSIAKANDEEKPLKSGE